MADEAERVGEFGDLRCMYGSVAALFGRSATIGDESRDETGQNRVHLAFGQGVDLNAFHAMLPEKRRPGGGRVMPGGLIRF